MSDMLGLIRTLYMGLTRDPDNWKLFPCLPWTRYPAWLCRALKGCFCLKSQGLNIAALGANTQCLDPAQGPAALQTDPGCSAAVLQCTSVAACCHHCLCFLLQCCVSAVGEERRPSSEVGTLQKLRDAVTAAVAAGMQNHQTVWSKEVTWLSLKGHIS